MIGLRYVRLNVQAALHTSAAGIPEHQRISLRRVLYNLGGFDLSDAQQIVETDLEYLFLRVPSCRALVATHC